ncbi:prolyl oligopeptidase family serine peptidase [Fimbriiglobus ruber]|uniref:Dipeptidyl aminopeptidase/acylaminoacyl-peptidase n=1 Tax=Fimbriiglobus ruber TaxID=1908690 RepID=A0A225DKI7_9BACT|nr:prolyl oligopeptidase family serine peptidase [Fimbriiglobus ruber]OWK41951.1 Dipeptidyl aminopeptidase/acylaminoacyl-peptidase [Fimbriiglobus ruber]
MSDRVTVLCGLAIAALSVAEASAQEGYRRPPKAVIDILDAPLPPAVSVSPTGEHLLFIWTGRYPPIADLAEPTVRLAGLRINPRTNGPARSTRVTRLKLLPIAGGEAKELELPAGKVSFPLWSPDGQRFAIMVTSEKGVGLWLGTVAGGPFVEAPGVALNAAVGEPVQWMPDNQSLLVQLVPEKRGAAPVAPAAPSGPVVQESSGKAAPVRTFQDLLQNPHDEALFAYYATSQLAVVQLAGGKATHQPLGEPGLVVSSDPSPDGKFVLVSRVKRPFSYLLTYSAFPRAVEVWDAAGAVAQTVADLPLQDKIPIEGVPTGPRSIRWLPTQPHTLLWVEAQDEGDPRKKVPFREAVFSRAVGAASEPREVLKLEFRFAGLDVFPSDNRMLVRDYDRDRKWSRTILASTSPLLGGEPKVLFERSAQDRYGDPGTPVTRTLPTGHRVLRTAGDPAGNTIWLAGSGATPKGDRPFLDRYDATTGKTTRVFHCEEGMMESVAAILNPAGTKLLVRRESPTSPPNYFYREPNHEKQLTETADPAPELRKAKKQLVTTKRADGTPISFTLHTPPGYKDGERLPAVIWAYPIEFASADTAGQVSGSPNTFTTITGYSHLFFLTQGYAVLEVSMPVVGPPASANDTFIEQLVSNAAASIDRAVELGVVDRDRVGVMGHSYGAFMTANLLAHSDLFRAGIARSGAYNRTLTPFGFQNERRTFWEAPEVYGKMSPFNHADKINKPLLLVHGAADNNPGTFPVQSERLYQAIRGNGGVCRLVLLPHESHGYEARETVEHVLYEQFAWFDKYVKNAGKK